jgi:hypothetical protein
MTSGFSLSLSQNQSSILVSPWAVSSTGRRSGDGGLGAEVT